MADVRVIQKPIYVIINCDECEDGITFEYSEFVKLHGEPCDWAYEKIKCGACEHENIIERWMFD